MQGSLAQEVISLAWDVGQVAGWVKPSLQNGIKEFDLRAGDVTLSQAQRDAYAKMALGARILGGLQIFQTLSGDRRATRR
jgi:hypothetical protein